MKVINVPKRKPIMKVSVLLSIISLTILAVLAAPTHATVLTFDTGQTNGAPIDQNYGDNVDSATQGSFSYGTDGGFTPDVVVAYSGIRQDTGAETGIRYWQTGYGDLVNVIENEFDGNSKIIITFTADAGFLVSLHSFDLANYWNYDGTVHNITIRDGSNNVLYTADDVSAPHGSPVPTHNSVSLPLGIQGGQLIMTLDIRLGSLGVDSDGIGLDNIKFSQSVQSVVPLPGALLLFATGLLGLGAAGWRRWS
jgi:hypothetical protein